MSRSLYCDTRLSGIEKWYSEMPPDALMRVPSILPKCVCFLSVKADGRFGAYDHCIGTAFFVELLEDGYLFRYLITAKHVINDEPEISVRLNTHNGKMQTVLLPNDWESPSNPAIDVALMPYNPPQEVFDYFPLDVGMFVFKGHVESYLSVGDETLVTGMFSRRQGVKRNIPILRSGIVAALLEEPFVHFSDDGSDVNYYDAYLVETRSIGGLSGSPVFVVKHQNPPALSAKLASQNPRVIADYLSKYRHPRFTTYLLGMIRSHWDLYRDDEGDRTDDEEIDAFNTGIAKVIPAWDIFDVIKKSEKFMKQREKEKASRERDDGETFD